MTEISSLRWQVFNTYRRFAPSSSTTCILFHCHETAYNLGHNALVLANGGFTKLRNFDHVMKTLIHTEVANGLFN